MANEKTKDEIEQAKTIAKDYWLYSPYNQKEIAEKVGVSVQTIIKWREKGGWDELKSDLLKIADKRFRHYTKLLDLLTTKLDAEKIDVDELTKLYSLIEKTQVKSTELSDIEKTGLALIKYLDEVMPEKRDFYISFFRSFAEWYSNRR